MPTEYLSSQLLLATKILSDVVPPWDLVRLQQREPLSQSAIKIQLWINFHTFPKYPQSVQKCCHQRFKSGSLSQTAKPKSKCRNIVNCFLQQYMVVHTLSPREALFLQVPRWELRFPPPPSPLPQFALHSVSQGPQGTDGKIFGKRILTNCCLCQPLDHDKDKNILAFPKNYTEERPQ